MRRTKVRPYSRVVKGKKVPVKGHTRRVPGRKIENRNIFDLAVENEDKLREMEEVIIIMDVDWDLDMVEQFDAEECELVTELEAYYDPDYGWGTSIYCELWDAGSDISGKDFNELLENLQEHYNKDALVETVYDPRVPVLKNRYYDSMLTNEQIENMEKLILHGHPKGWDKELSIELLGDKRVNQLEKLRKHFDEQYEAGIPDY